MNRGFAPIIVLVITALVVVGVGGYLVFGPEKESALSEDKSVQPVVDETAGWKTYRNEEYGFEFQYPLELEPDEYKTGSQYDVLFARGKDFNLSVRLFNKEDYPRYFMGDLLGCEGQAVIPCSEYSFQIAGSHYTGPESFWIKRGVIYNEDFSSRAEIRVSFGFCEKLRQLRLPALAFCSETTSPTPIVTDGVVDDFVKQGYADEDDYKNLQAFNFMFSTAEFIK